MAIWRPDKSGKPIRFDTANRTALHSYSFSTSINDEKGRFSLTFYPDDADVPYGADTLLDEIQIMDIVEIYETRNHFRQGEVIGYDERLIRGDIKYKNFPDNTDGNGVSIRTMTTRTPIKAPDTIFPTFIGVIREKKIVAQMRDKGATRKFVVTGHSVVGLVHEFKINLDMRASVLTGQMANNEEIQNELTQQFIQGTDPLDVRFVVEKIWESFLNLSSRYDKLSTPKIAEYIKTWIGGEDVLFCIDNSKFNYPLASVFMGQTTQTFYDIISGIIPKPAYEVYPYMDRSIGKMRLMIRIVPFGEEAWKKLDTIVIKPEMVKAFELSQNDNEVFTVFFSYLTGSAIQEDVAIVLTAQDVKAYPGITEDKEKYGIYGYRPLFVNFNGYGKADGKTDTDTAERLISLNKELKKWYGNKEKMYSGSITMETNLSADMPQAGEKIKFLEGEFYVIDSEHSWSYGGAPETRISIDRGGDYDSNGAWHEMKSVTGRYRNFTGEGGGVTTKWR